MKVFLKILVYLAVFLGAFGMVGMLYLMIQNTHTRVVRPDLQLDARIEEMNAPGRLSILVTRNKFPIFNKQWPAHEVVNATPFQLGSLGELFIGHAIQNLADTAQLGLDAPIGAHLPNLHEALKSLTPAQLLTHSSGLKATVDLTQPGPLTPGQQSEWAPANYQLLDQLVRAVAKQSPFQVVQANLLPGLAMATEKSPDLPLAIVGLNFREEDKSWWAHPQDLKRWELAMNTGILGKMKTHLRATRPAELAGKQRGDFGFGWEISEYYGLRLEEFYAREDQFGAGIFRFAEKTFSIVITTDQPTDVVDVRKLAREIAVFYLGREFPTPRTETRP